MAGMVEARSAIVHEIVIDECFHRTRGFCRGVCHRRELGAAADPHIAEAVAERGMKQRGVSPDGAHRDDRIRGIALGMGIIDDLPVPSFS